MRGGASKRGVERESGGSIESPSGQNGDTLTKISIG